MLPPASVTTYNNISRHNPQLPATQGSTNKLVIARRICSSIPQPAQTTILCKLIAIKYHRQGLWNDEGSINLQNKLWAEISDLLPENTVTLDSLMFFIKNDEYTGYLFQRKIPAEFQDLLRQLEDFEKQNIINSFSDADREMMCNFLAGATDQDWGAVGDKRGLTRNPSVYSSGQLLNKSDFFSPEELRQGARDIEQYIWDLQVYADAGHPVAQNRLGEVYGDVYHVNPQEWPKDEAKAVQYFAQSADKGNSKAKYNLLTMFSDNRGIRDADEVTRSRAVQMLKEGAQEYANSILGMNCRKALTSEFLEETEDAEAIKWLDEMMEHHPLLDTLGKIADILCRSEDARKALGESKANDYLKQAAEEKKLQHSKAASTYAEICANSEYSFLRDGFGTPQETAARYRQLSTELDNQQTKV
jgi:TPR repeat protein